MERFADFVVNNRIKVALVTMLLAFGVFAGIPNLKLDTDGRVFMPPTIRTRSVSTGSNRNSPRTTIWRSSSFRLMARCSRRARSAPSGA